MKIFRAGPAGGEKPFVSVADRTYSLGPLTSDIDSAFLGNGGVEEVRQALASGVLPESDLPAGIRIGSPIARPGSVICVGMNYAAHAAESDSTPPETPVIFLKPANTVVGPHDDVTIPKGSSKTDWEVELGIVIGAAAEYLDSVSDSRGHIAGFVVVNDVSERRFQFDDSGGQWSKGKAAPGFTPTGPWLVPPDAVDASGLRLRTWVNGSARQDSSTADMIFSAEYIVWHLSQYMRLDPGDLVLTGTPEGVALSGRFPYLRDGDIVEMEIDGLGRQRQRFVNHG
ncbi:fumarylacetoacetate hydrolase family protein [Nocardia sp. R6R-6]|uniref:fumarylacetoacetate hydrolase family protein n=1 Tax=Nocardia sp. R6R-6 TaxID=3459303 RepID=UPI00403DC453